MLPSQHRGPRSRLRRQRRILLSYLLFTCSLLLRHRAEGASQTENYRIPYVSGSLRGGAGLGDSQEPETERVWDSRIWDLSNLFRLNRKGKAKGLFLDENEGENDVTAKPGPDSRGGALVKTKPPPRRFHWLAPLDTSRVAPLSSRLLKDDEAEVMTELPGANHSSTIAKDARADELLNNRTDDEDGFSRTDDSEEVERTLVPVMDKLSAAASKKKKSKTLREAIDEQRQQSASARKEDETEVAPPESRKAIADDKLDVDTEKEEGMSEELIVTEKDVETSSSSEKVTTNSTSVQSRPVLSLPPPIKETEEKTPSTASPDVSPYLSSGYWKSIDRLLTAGYADDHPAWRVSRHLRAVRKATARVTGLHGALSGKGRDMKKAFARPSSIIDDVHMSAVRRRLTAIRQARAKIERLEPASKRKGSSTPTDEEEPPLSSEYTFVVKKSLEEIRQEQRRKDRVKDIDEQIVAAQQLLQELACEKDVLQRRPNPMWNYTIEDVVTARVDDETDDVEGEIGITASRTFNFPPKELVDDYLDMLFVSDRLVKLNHTDLWRNGGGSLDEDDDDDELLEEFSDSGRRRRNKKNGSGSWMLRNGLGEKIGETAETAAYKSVCHAVMSILARSLSSLHGVNIMDWTDIRLFMEQAPDLPPLAAGIIPGSGMSGSNYAQKAIQSAMRRGARKSKKRRHRYRSEDTFVQRDAVVETLLSHCQISAPLLTMFPLAWQRAMLGNIITLICAIVSDFFDGLQFQILGHQLSFSFTPITEADMMRHIGLVGDGFNRHRARPDQFEAAVRATAEDLSENLKFLDRWHERALGSDILRTQIANLIARLVLTLADDVLTGARMDLWTAHAGGPRLVAGLEYRTAPQYMDAT